MKKVFFTMAMVSSLLINSNQVKAATLDQIYESETAYLETACENQNVSFSKGNKLVAEMKYTNDAVCVVKSITKNNKIEKVVLMTVTSSYTWPMKVGVSQNISDAVKQNGMHVVVLYINEGDKADKDAIASCRNFVKRHNFDIEIIDSNKFNEIFPD